jgi:hypothetical protein
MALAFTVETDLPPERVLAAATDFTDKRPDIWPNLSRKFWKLHDSGPGWAECTEGTDIAGGIWARERYEWSGNRVVGTVQDSNIFKSGTWTMTVDPLPNGGSRITVVNDRVPRGKGWLFRPMMLLVGKKMLAGHLEKTLEIVRQQG